MVKRFSLLCLCVLVARTVAADTLVTWQSIGEIGFASPSAWVDAGRLPTPGTPYHLTMTFDPASMTPTPSSPPGSNCVMVNVTGSLTLGGYAYSTGGRGFTHAQLPGTNCTPGEPTTQFLLGFVDAPADSPWPIIEFGFIELWYMDRFVRDAFPMVPTSQGGGFQIRDGSRLFNVSASLDLQAVEQPAAVPEPGTLTLVGVGLAAVVRKIRRRGVTHH